MRYFFFLIVFVLGIYACASGDNNSAAENTTTITVSIDAEKIWKARCISCHGRYGNMEANGAANLQEATSDLAYRVGIITNGKGVMTPWGSILSKEEIEAVAKYTMTFNKDLEVDGK